MPQTGPGSGAPAAPAAPSERQKFLDFLHSALGDPYVYGATGPSSFDCSGLVYWALRKVGINIGRTSEDMWNNTIHIRRSQLQPGDLIFEQWPGDNAAPGHVVIWLGNGRIEQAPQSGELVQTDAFTPDQVAREGGRVVGYGRIPGLHGGGVSAKVGGPGGGGSGGSSVWGDWLSGAITGLTGQPWSASVPEGQSISASGAGLLSIGSAMVSFMQKIDWLFEPSHWVRIICFALGVPVFGWGVLTMTKTVPALPGPAGAAAAGAGIGPALGILEVVAGSMLLFVAFHNIPATNLAELIAYFQGQITPQAALATGTTPATGAGNGG